MMTTPLCETAGAIAALLLGHVRDQAGEDAVAAVLADAAIDASPTSFEQPSSCISYEERLRLLAAMTRVLDDPQAPRRAAIGAAGTARRLGLSLGLHHPSTAVLWAATTPADVIRALPHALPAFSTTAEMTLVQVRPTAATVRFVQRARFAPDPLDCQLVQGALAAIPTIFDLPPATVVHEECQVDGAAGCHYQIAWTVPVPTTSGEDRRRPVDLELGALRAQLRHLQVAASELVASDDVETVLDRIVSRAAAVVPASYLLVVRDDDEPTVRSQGLDEEQVASLTEAVLTYGDPGPDVVIVDIASDRALHGHLAAVRPEGNPASDEDRALLEAYTRHAAAALDMLTALESSRRETTRATALLTLANDLSAARDDQAAAEVVARALPRIAGGRTASVLLWDASAGELRAVANHGHHADQQDSLYGSTIRADDTPEIVQLLMHRGPVIIDVELASPGLKAYLSSVGSRTTIAAPLLAGDVLLGVVAVGWPFRVPAATRQEAVSRIVGVADQATSALQRTRLLATVQFQADHDSMTGLPNRSLFARVLEDELGRADDDSTTAVLFCDLDRFKQVNDRLGHAAGDEMLRQVAARLCDELSAREVVARLSGDEFAVLLPRAVDENHAVAVARRLVACLDQPLRIEGREVRITSSIGVALHTGPDGRSDLLLAAANAAVHEAKQRGRDQVAVDGESASRAGAPSFESELGQAISRGQMRLHFQPIVDVSVPGEGVVVGAEALLRWEHPRLGLLQPGAFLPLAEESGLITELDLWAISAACRALVDWRPATGAGSSPAPLRVAVNLAVPTLLDKRLLPTVRSALTENGLGPEQLHLEIVESRSLTDADGVIEHLTELRQMGLRISLDDFGTGFSTLAWLHTLPVDQIKIDRSFVKTLTAGGSDALVRGVLALARELGIEVVAEGVEEPHQLSTLRAAGCEMVQGYLLGKPEPKFVARVLPDRSTDA